MNDNQANESRLHQGEKITPLPFSENDKIKLEIEEFSKHIDDYRVTLNKEGVWLFLATLGCWSVQQKWLQLIAILISFLLFSHRIFSNISDKRAFSKKVKDLEDNIKNKIEPGDTQKARLYDVILLKSGKLAIKDTLKNTAIFFVCYSFLAATLFYWYFEVMPVGKVK